MNLSRPSESAEFVAYHKTDTENVESIYTDGLTATSPAGPDTNLTVEGLGEARNRLPFNRERAVYAYLEPPQVAASEQDDLGGLAVPDETTLVIDLQKVDAPLFLSDMSLASDLNDIAMGVDPMHSDSPEEAVEAYLECVVEVDSHEGIRNYDAGVSDVIELIIAGDVPPAAITRILRPA